MAVFLITGCNGKEQTVTHKGEQCFVETENTTCPLYAQGVLKKCVSDGAGGWKCTHIVK